MTHDELMQLAMRNAIVRLNEQRAHELSAAHECARKGDIEGCRNHLDRAAFWEREHRKAKQAHADMLAGGSPWHRRLARWFESCLNAPGGY